MFVGENRATILKAILTYCFRFEDFSDTPAKDGGALALGFDGFFKGAYGYHSHISRYELRSRNLEYVWRS